jgi:hypothetical protein
VPLLDAPPGSFVRVRPLVPSSDAAGHMAFVHALLDQTMPGRMFVDDVEGPRSAVACSDSGFWFALGEPRGDLLRESLDALKSALPASPASLYATTPAWQVALDPLFWLRVSRNEYHFIALPSQAPPLPIGFSLVPLDARIARLFAGSVDPWVIDIWGGPERFAERVFGWAMMRGDQLASFCTACALGGGEAEVEIGTNPEFRRLGLAEAAGYAFARTALERGLRPAWTCSTGNAGSERLAAKLGFVEFRRVTGYPMTALTEVAPAAPSP